MRKERHLQALTGREREGPLRVDRRHPRWGNKHRIGPGVTRAQAIERYARDLWARVRSGEVTRAELRGLHGRDLVCWCVPLECHAEVLMDAIAWAMSDEPIPQGDGWRRAA